MDKRAEDIKKLREAMGTLPAEEPPREDKIYWGLSHLNVEMITHTENPYRAIYELVTSTWGSREGWWNRWENATPEGRLKVVLAALQRKTLPQALEVATFTFKIQGITRSSFDHFARHRHAGIGSMGSRDNSHVDAAIVLPVALKPYERLIRQWWHKTKNLYFTMVKDWDSGIRANWQNARAVLPMSMEWRFTICFNYRGLQDVCAQRLGFHEQWDTVGCTWAIRREVEKKFPLLAAFMRPACDFSKRCLYSQVYQLSELFSCLFAPCGRWPTKSSPDTYITFNESCSNIEILEKELGFHIPRPEEWDSIVEKAIEKDRRFFE